MKTLTRRPSAQVMQGSDFNALLELIMTMRIGFGTGFTATKTSAGTFVSRSEPVQNTPRVLYSGCINGLFPAQITGSTADGDNRWSYTFKEVAKSGTGYTDWTATDISGNARNLVEVGNSATGVQGNGVDVDGEDFPEGFEIQPCPTGTYVLMYRMLPNVDEPVAEYWFGYENGIDGTCD